MKKIISTIISLVILSNLSVSAQNMTSAQYIERYKSLAIESMRQYGIPASIKLAQGLVETSSGNSRLAKEANNHFGIKCKSTWTGQTISHDDDAAGECFRKYSSAEESYRDHSEFLKGSDRYKVLFSYDQTDYKSWAKGLSTAGYATNPKYPLLLIKAIEDYELYLVDEEALNSAPEKSPIIEAEPPKKTEQPTVEPITHVEVVFEEPVKKVKQKKQKPAKQPKQPKQQTIHTTGSLNSAVIPQPLRAGETKSTSSSLKKVFFASNKTGIKMPNNIYDGPKLDKNNFIKVKSVPRDIYKTNNVLFIVTADNETFESLSSQLKISAAKLMSYNEINGSHVKITKGSIIYTTLKNTKVTNGFKIHTVRKGESLHSISQTYGVKMISLAKLNGFSVGYNVSVGQRIKLN